MRKPKPVRIAIVAGEVSGDVLAAGLIQEIRRKLPGAVFEGIAGPRMRAEGCRQLYPMDELTLMGFESFGRLFRILGIRRALARRWRQKPPHVFVGVDAPDFNLSLERRLRRAGVPTVHYVSPTVWAWRRWRVGKIRRAVDRILVLFPFEEAFYRARNVPVRFVGHPLADSIPLQQNSRRARAALRLEPDQPVVALLPGSRHGELRRHADLFVRAAMWLHQRHPQWRFVAPFASEETRELFERALERHAAAWLPITLTLDDSRTAMTAADVVLCASGTAALEAALLGRPMVVMYRISWQSYLLVRPMLHVKLFSMPNHLAGRALVPEFMQGDATIENIAPAVERLVLQTDEAEHMRRELKSMHRSLRCRADSRAAHAVIEMLPTPRKPRTKR